MISIKTQVVRHEIKVSRLSMTECSSLQYDTRPRPLYLKCISNLNAISSTLVNMCLSICDNYRFLTFMCRNLIDPYTNWSSLPTASSSPWASWEPLKLTTFGVFHINFITKMFFYLHGQDISRAGVKLLPPGEGPEGEF